MATYAIGDVQGCFDELQALLGVLSFDPKKDTLWFTGDLANRGAKPYESLQFIKALGAISVLGNHDLALLAALEGIIHLPPDDPANIILGVPINEKRALCEWLRHLPLLHFDKALSVVMTHAGIYPKWDLAQAQQYAHEVEALLRSDQYIDFLKVMYGNAPSHWDESLTGMDRMRFILNCFTRMRFVTQDGELDLHAKRTPKDHPQLFPWYAFPHRVPIQETVVFGHWSALQGQCSTPNIFALDEGCIWGGALAAICLETTERYLVKK